MLFYSLVLQTLFFPVSVAAKVRHFKVTVGDDVIVSWSQSDPPRGVILFYNIRINDQQNLYSAVLAEYTQTSITKCALMQSLNLTNAAIILQVF